MDVVLALLKLGIVALFAGLGAYFGTYLKQKAKNLATHEDIEKLVEDVRATRLATKQIEAKIEGELWDRQQRWETRKDVILKSLRSVGKAQSIMTKTITALDRYDNAKSEPDKSRMAAEAEALVLQCKDGITTWRNPSLSLCLSPDLL